MTRRSAERRTDFLRCVSLVGATVVLRCVSLVGATVFLRRVP
jgi:hypothetical protein